MVEKGGDIFTHIYEFSCIDSCGFYVIHKVAYQSKLRSTYMEKIVDAHDELYDHSEGTCKFVATFLDNKIDD